MASVRTQILGDSSFHRGVNSQVDPSQLGDGLARQAMNMVNRGGVWQVRPGFRWHFTMPTGRLQGGHLFRPIVGLEQLVFAVDGVIYASPYPFSEYARIGTIQFKADVDSVYFETGVKASEVQPDGSLKVVTPFSVLIIQDGASQPAAWDGVNSRHLPDPLDTPLGTVMKWSGDRLWVLRGRELFASDPFDPLSFREGTYFSNARSFLLPRDGTAMAEVTYGSDTALLVFTDSTSTAFRSNVRKRVDWSDPEVRFQNLIFPSIGCVAHRSTVTLNGLLWWYSQHGLTNFNAALATQQTSEIDYQDGEMASSKGQLSDRRSSIAFAAFENYLLASVPSGDSFNRHTWVLDKEPIGTKDQKSADAWNGFWTGTRPVEWAGGQIQGRERIFQFSADKDGNNRCWEAFTDERTDHGCPIIWSLETRGYTAGTLDDKEFRQAELFLSELLGKINLSVFWAGTSRGAYKRILTTVIHAEEGILTDSPDFEVTSDRTFFGLKKQSRRVMTKDIKFSRPTDTSCKIESNLSERVDIGHQLLIVGSGQAAIRAIRVSLDPVPTSTEGCPDDEDSDTNFVRFDGAGAETLEGLEEIQIEIFTSTKFSSQSFGGESYLAVGTSESRVSQQDADDIAQCQADADAFEWLATKVPAYVGNPDDPTI